MADQAQGAVSEKVFKAASEWLTSTPAAAQLPNETKLELYGLYKHITNGQPTGSRPSIFYPTPRAKYDAWATNHAKYSALQEGTEVARGRYVEIAKTVGWKGEGLAEEDEEEEEIDFDAPDPALAEKVGESSKPIPGMGPRQSVMAQDVDPGSTETGESSAIHDAVVDNNVDEVRRLLSADPASLDARNDIGSTPLHLAADRGHVEIAKLLVAAGADKTAQDEDEQTPLQIAEMLARTEIVALLR